jgi:hypothetical protein
MTISGGCDRKEIDFRYNEDSMIDNNTNPGKLPIPRTTAHLVDVIRRQRSSLEAFLTELDPATFVAVDSPEGWSIKDHLMHLIAWEEVMLGAIVGEPEHETLGLEKSVASTISVDDLNEIFFRRNRDVPLATAWKTFRAGRHSAVSRCTRWPPST